MRAKGGSGLSGAHPNFFKSEFLRFWETSSFRQPHAVLATSQARSPAANGAEAVDKLAYFWETAFIYIFEN